MLIIPPPMSNAERQRLFQLRHPGYDRRRKARQRSATKQSVQAKQWQAVLAAQAAAAPAVPATPRLMLPAPVQDPWMAEIEGLKASLVARRSGQESREPAYAPAVPIQQPALRPPR